MLLCLLLAINGATVCCKTHIQAKVANQESLMYANWSETSQAAEGKATYPVGLPHRGVVVGTVELLTGHVPGMREVAGRQQQKQ